MSYPRFGEAPKYLDEFRHFRRRILIRHVLYINYQRNSDLQCGGLFLWLFLHSIGLRYRFLLDWSHILNASRRDARRDRSVKEIRLWYGTYKAEGRFFRASCIPADSDIKSCTSELSLPMPSSAASRREDTFREVHMSVMALRLVWDLC